MCDFSWKNRADWEAHKVINGHERNSLKILLLGTGKKKQRGKK